MGAIFSGFFGTKAIKDADPKEELFSATRYVPDVPKQEVWVLDLDSLTDFEQVRYIQKGKFFTMKALENRTTPYRW